MLVFGKEQGIALFLRNGNGSNLLAQAAGALCVGSALLAAKSEEILILARNMKFLGDDFAGFGHGVGAVFGLHQRVDEAPADGGVFEFRGAREGTVGFAHDEGGARHAFDAAGDSEVAFAGLDGARNGTDGVHAGAAEAIYG